MERSFPLFDLGGNGGWSGWMGERDEEGERAVSGGGGGVADLPSCRVALSTVGEKNFHLFSIILHFFCISYVAMKLATEH